MSKILRKISNKKKELLERIIGGGKSTIDSGLISKQPYNHVYNDGFEVFV